MLSISQIYFFSHCYISLSWILPLNKQASRQEKVRRKRSHKFVSIFNGIHSYLKLILPWNSLFHSDPPMKTSVSGSCITCTCTTGIDPFDLLAYKEDINYSLYSHWGSHGGIKRRQSRTTNIFINQNSFNQTNTLILMGSLQQSISLIVFAYLH